jgi:hypothetical protein
MKPFAAALPTAVLLGLALPAGAQAATLSVQQTCFVSGADARVVGTGYTPGALVRLEGTDLSGSATADAAGNIDTTVRPYLTGGNRVTPKTFTLTASEGGAPLASVSFPVVGDLFMVDANLNGPPSSTVRWRFAGFQPGKPVYGHYRFGGRTIRNYRFGVAKGPCGTLTARARRLPTKVRYGTWKLKFDSRRSYSAKEPGRLGEMRIFKRFSRR